LFNSQVSSSLVGRRIKSVDAMGTVTAVFQNNRYRGESRWLRVLWDDGLVSSARMDLVTINNNAMEIKWTLKDKR
jgi:hypothetical protein